MRQQPVSRMWKSAAVQACVNCAASVLALLLFSVNAAAASHGPYVYAVTFNSQFGTVDLSTGAFRQIGPATPEPLATLVWWGESHLSLSISGNLVRIDPTTGVTTPIGPTGLGFNAFALAEVRGKLYLTDFNNNIYTVDPQTGAATMLRVTGLPPDPAIPFTSNSDGTINLCDETLYGVGGELFATFDAFTVDPNSLVEVADNCCGPALYMIDPNTGIATLVAPHTTMNLGAAVLANGTYYAFRWVLTAFSEFGPLVRSQLLTLDLTTGKTTPLENAAGPIFVDAAAGGITGAVPAPAIVGKNFPALNELNQRRWNDRGSN